MVARICRDLAEPEEHQRRDEIDEARHGLHDIEHRQSDVADDAALRDENPHGHADHHRDDGRHQHQGERLHRQIPESEDADGNQQRAYGQRQRPAPRTPPGKRHEGENDEPPGQAAQDPFDEQNGLQDDAADRLEDPAIIGDEGLDEVVHRRADREIERVRKHRISFLVQVGGGKPRPSWPGEAAFRLRSQRPAWWRGAGDCRPERATVT